MNSKFVKTHPYLTSVETWNEKLFYEDQHGERRHLLSQEIDTEYEAEQLKIQQAEVELETSYHEELNYINEELFFLINFYLYFHQIYKH